MSAAASTLLSECAGLRIVATSREPLGVAGELTWRVPPLALPPMCRTYAVDSLAAYDAVRLFIDRAQLVRPSFEVTVSNAPAVAEICQRLDGIPLAIELAAARVRQLTVERIVTAIDDRFRLLTGGVRASLPRQQTLRASIEWSYDLLDDAEQSVLICLGVFVGGFGIDAVEQVVAQVEPTFDPYLVFDVLARLIDKSLIAIDDAGRYRMLESIRSFAIERAVHCGRLGPLRDAHLAWTLSLVEAWALHRVFPSSSVESELSAELANLSAALEWSIGQKTVSPAIGLLRPLTRRWYEITSFDEAASWAQRLLATTEDELLRHQIVAEFAELAAFSGHIELVEAASGAFRSALESRGDMVLSRAARVFGLAANFGDPDAFAYLERGRDAARNAQDPFGEFELCLMLAVGHRSCNCGDAMQAEMERAAVIATWPHPMMTMHRAMQCATHCFSGAYDEALRLALAEPEGVTAAHAYMVPFGVVAALAVGDERALGEMASRVQRMPRSGVPGSMGAMSTLTLSLARDDIDAAAAQLRAMLQQPPVLGASGLMALLVWGALVADATGDPSLRGELTDLIPAPRSDAPVPESFGASFARAHAAIEPDTWNALHEALAIASDGNLVLFLPVALGAVAELHFAEGRATIGLALLAAIEHDLTMRHGWPISPIHRRRQLAAAEAHGPLPQPALSLQEAAALALRSRGDRQRPSTGWGSLTPTERQVTTLAADGLSNVEIAGRLIMSANTVKTHLSHIFTKLGLRNRAELATLATKQDTGREG